MALYLPGSGLPAACRPWGAQARHLCHKPSSRARSPGAHWGKAAPPAWVAASSWLSRAASAAQWGRASCRCYSHVCCSNQPFFTWSRRVGRRAWVKESSSFAAFTICPDITCGARGVPAGFPSWKDSVHVCVTPVGTRHHCNYCGAIIN